MVANMDPFGGITLEVVCNGQSLPFYDDPDHDASEIRTRGRYIEAITGAEFEVKLTLDAQYDLGTYEHNEAIHIAVWLDSRGSSVWNSYSLEDLKWDLQRDKKKSFTFCSIWSYCASSRQWATGHAKFTELDVCECLSRLTRILCSKGKPLTQNSSRR